MSDWRERADRVLESPLEPEAYARFVREAAPASDYLFTEPRARFEPRAGDVVRAPPDLVVTPTVKGCRLSSAALSGGVDVPGVGEDAARRLLEAVDAQRTLSQIEQVADPAAFRRLLEAAFGWVLFAPEAVSALETELSGTELVRFARTPYEIVRSYWENSIDVRRRAEESLDDATSQDPETRLRWLRRLHVIALLGDSQESYYRPESRIARRGISPGKLDLTPGETLRVGVPLVGGEHYHALLYRAAGDPEALLPERELTEAGGLSWGRVATETTKKGERAFFYPPRPVRPEHLGRLLGSYQKALQTRTRGALEALSRFHRAFVRLHPFRAANQSLSMNLMNLVLERTRGAAIPHLLLDQLALRLNEAAYARVFTLAVEEHALAGSAAERWARLRESTGRVENLVTKLGHATSLAQAEALARTEKPAARLSLIAI